MDCSFKKSLRYGDTVIVETTFIPCDAAKIKFSYRLFNKKTLDLVATGNSVQVFLDREHSSLQLLNPPFFEEWKRKYLSSQTASMRNVYVVADNIFSPLGKNTLTNMDALKKGLSGIRLHNTGFSPEPFYASLFSLGGKNR